MGTEKRERQKANRQARLEQMEREQKRSSSRKRFIRIGIIVVVAVAAAFGLSRLIGSDDDGEDVAAADTTLATESTIPGTTLAPITGETPCPAADGSSAHVTAFENPPPMCIDPSKTYTATVDT
ncbi:MAG TPA: hypothetical protein VL916_04765, partial [Ilumatobacteraceae bacterium]|nr:hypothetical protein [Ilumatobacteraceae bacterium]